MSINLEEKFISYCNLKNLELNPNQIIIIKKLNNYYDDNFKNSFLNFFLKKSFKKRFLSLWWCRSWKNYDFRFFF